MMIKSFIGTRSFYKRLFIILIPLVLQQAITCFVGLLDNLMVGSLGTASISAVAVVNQIIWVSNLAVFGMLSGASIFGAQFFGKGDFEGLKYTFRFRLVFTVLLTSAFVTAFIVFTEPLLLMFLENESNSPELIAETLEIAKEYFAVMLIGLIPYAIAQIYASTLRDSGETFSPMLASAIAVGVNLILNYILIFGKFGAPALGVIGAGIATTVSRFVEMFFIIIRTHTRTDRFVFFKGAYSSLRIPAKYIKSIFKTGTPLMMNEILWALGMSFVSLNYAVRGIGVIAATQINNTVWQLFAVVMMSMGSAASIIICQKLGSGDTEGARHDANVLLFFSFASHIIIGLLIVAASPFVPLLYNVTDDVRALVTQFLIISGSVLPISAFVHCSYFTIRSGGKTFITFLFDSCFTWCVPVVVSFVLCRFTLISIVHIFLIVNLCDAIKAIIAIPMLKSGFWAKNIVK